MRIVFMGTPEFAEVSLSRLYADGHSIPAVFTQPDKPKNRGLKEAGSPVKVTALLNGSRVYQPETLKSPEVFDTLKELSPDLIVVVAYGKLLPGEILDIPQYGCVNIHGSILPKYRGAAPVQRAILNGEKTTGVTAMYLDEGMDSGDIINVMSTDIGINETAGQLMSRLGVLGAQLLSETLDMIGQGSASRTPQNNKDATYAPPLTKELSPIDWEESAFHVHCRIRGLNPWPLASANIGGRDLKIYASEMTGNSARSAPGSVVYAGARGVEVACADETIMLTQVQAAGGKRMSAADYLRGHPIWV